MQRTLLHNLLLIGMPILLVCFLVFMFSKRQEPGVERSPISQSADEPLDYQFPVMNTVAEIRLYGRPADCEKACASAREAILEVEKTCNIFATESELSRLNASAADTPFKCSPLLWEALEHSRRYNRISRGSIDISIGPLMTLWGFHKKSGKLPAQEEIDTALKTVGLDKVEFDDAKRTVSFKIKGMSLDLGGVAKGFALDKAAEKVLALGVNRGLIKIGGNMRCLPLPPPGRDAYNIGIQSPFDKKEICSVVKVLNSSIGTSGNYENYVVIDGHHYTHIMNPKTGRPVENMLSATIITPLGADSDGLSKALFVNGPEAAKELCESMPRTEALIIRRDPADSSKLIIEKFGPAWGEITIEEPRNPKEAQAK